ncbi:MAG: DUF5615 family PIN-like protein, partial [Waterburya sp.]
MTLKLLIDEDSQAKILVNLLLHAGHNVLTVNEANLSGKSDSIVFDYACSKNPVFFMIRITICLGVFWFSSCWGMQSAIANTTNKASEINLKIGILQRLGAAPMDEDDPEIKQVTINSTAGDSLKVSFPDQSQSTPAISTEKVLLKVDSEPLPQPKLDEKLILSDRSTFETAEDSANSWKKLGIEVEVAQPGRWQVWAKRDVYS